MNILGISYSIHESAACLVQDGELTFACAEERLSGVKQDGRFPVRAIQAALDHAGIRAGEIDHVAIGWSKPGVQSRHDLKMLLNGQRSLSRMRLERTFLGWLKNRRHRGGWTDYTRAFELPRQRVHFVDHHLAHALSAFVPSGFEESAVLIVDGRGATEATTLWHAAHGRIKLLETFQYPNSLGLFYAGITRMLGFKALSDEWKVMGLASYGEPTFDLSSLIRVSPNDYKVNIRPFLAGVDGDLRSLESIVGPSRSYGELTQRHKDLAHSTQRDCERAMTELLRRITRSTGSRRLCLAGGVALNCKANGELLRSGLIDEIFVQPAAGDDGACIGAAYAVYQILGQQLPSRPTGHTYLGTEYSDEEIGSVLRVYKLNYCTIDDPSKVAAYLLSQNALVAWYQGRMEFGPRALGNRSILADPRYVENRDRVNEAVKFRENWRPFAPSVLEERGHEFFQDFRSSPYMILSFWATEEAKRRIPAVVHVDGSCRVQSVTRCSNYKYYALISEFERLTGVGAVMNTSFNLKGDAIVESPKEAVETFYTSGLDFLIMGNYLVGKHQDLRAIVESFRQGTAGKTSQRFTNGDVPNLSHVVGSAGN